MEQEDKWQVIGDNLRRYRLLKKMTQEELSTGLCSVSQLSKAENGKTVIKPELLREMARRLGVTVEQLESVDTHYDEVAEMLLMARSLYTKGEQDRALMVARQVIAQSREHGYENLLLAAVLVESWVLIARFEYDAVIDNIKNTFANDVTEESMEQVNLMQKLADLYAQIGDETESGVWSERSETVFARVEGGEPRARAMALFHLARHHGDMGRYWRCLYYIREGMQVSDEHSFHIVRVRLKGLQGECFEQMGEWDKAEETYLSLLQELRANNMMFDIALITALYGRMLWHRGELAQAKVQLHQAAQKHKLIGESEWLCLPLLDLGEVALLEGDATKAREYAQEVLGFAERLGVGAVRWKAHALHLMGKSKHLLGEFEEFVFYMEEASKTYGLRITGEEQWQILTCLGDALYERGDERAADAYRRAIQFDRTVHKPRERSAF